MQVTSVIDIREVIRYLKAGESQRATAEALGLARNTVTRYEKWAREQGWFEMGCELPNEAAMAEGIKALYAPSAQTISRLEPYRGVIEAWRKAGVGVSMLSVQQRLAREHTLQCSYSSLWSYVRKIEGIDEPSNITIRVETPPGEEAQVDFGYAGRMWNPILKKACKAWAFVMTLGWSRHVFVTFVFDQRVETWLDCHRRAFEYFGGVPERVKLDNLKAAILRASQDDPKVQRAYRECAEHDGFLISPCRVATPQHKGKVESAVKYVKRNFLAGRDYSQPGCDITQANQDVLAWIEETAGQRIHGTTREQPLARFHQVEKAALKPLPETRFEAAIWTELKLHRDGYVVFEKSYYSGPYRYIGQTLSVRATLKMVELHAGYALVATHSRATQAGQRLTNPAHLPPNKAKGLLLSPLMEFVGTYRQRAEAIGPFTAQAIELLLADKVVDRHSSAHRLIGLADKHSKAVLERACKHAFELGDPSPTTIRNMVKICTASVSGMAGVEWTHAGTGHGEALSAPTPAFARPVEELIPAMAMAMATVAAEVAA
jgi:transposase